MKNENLKRMIGEVVEEKRKSEKRGQLTTTIDYDLLEDYKESMKLLNKPMGLGFDCMLRLIYENEEFFKAFIKELEKF